MLVSWSITCQILILVTWNKMEKNLEQRIYLILDDPKRARTQPLSSRTPSPLRCIVQFFEVELNGCLWLGSTSLIWSWKPTDVRWLTDPQVLKTYEDPTDSKRIVEDPKDSCSQPRIESHHKRWFQNVPKLPSGCPLCAGRTCQRSRMLPSPGRLDPTFVKTLIDQYSCHILSRFSMNCTNCTPQYSTISRHMLLTPNTWTASATVSFCDSQA